jgi:hypothetical protein
MSVKEFHLFHGIVLTKLVRSDRPVTLRMIETRPGEAWSSYTLNADAADLFIKHSTSWRATERKGGGKSWSFVFGTNQVRQMAASARRRPTFAVLVCGDRSTGAKGMQVCLLEPQHLSELIDFASSRQQAITVSYHPGRKLRVYKGRRERLRIAQGALDSWRVPGS